MCIHFIFFNHYFASLGDQSVLCFSQRSDCHSDLIKLCHFNWIFFFFFLISKSRKLSLSGIGQDKAGFFWRKTQLHGVNHKTGPPQSDFQCLWSLLWEFHGLEQNWKKYLKNITLLMEKYGAPGTAFERFYFLRSQHVLPEEEEEFFRTPGEQLVSYWRWKSQQEKKGNV